MSSTSPLVWLIIGCSSGFGHEFCTQLLSLKQHVIATSRNPFSLSSLASLGAHTLALDISASDSSVAAAIRDAEAIYGHIDVLVNNAGYVLEGFIEECTDEEVAKQFDTNVFGQLRVVRAVAPGMRKRGKGMVGMIGSVAGWKNGVGYSVYGTTKWAVAGLCLGLKVELAPFGIDVVCIEPGYFRTSLLTSGRRITGSNNLPELASEPTLAAAREALAKANMNQPGDPVKGVKVMIEALSKTGRFEGWKTLPGRLPLGDDSYEVVINLLEREVREILALAPLATGTDCDDVRKK